MMKKLLSAVCAASLCASITCFAAQSPPSETYTDENGNVFEYMEGSQYGEDTLSIHAVTLTDPTVLDIPGKINGKPVTSIPTGVLTGYKNTIEKITVNSNMYVDCQAFPSLTSLTFSDGVTEIADGIYSDCPKLTKIVLPDGLIKIGNEMFAGSTALKSITIPDTVTRIGDFAFADCTALTSVTIPDGVTEIAMNCFEGCTSLQSVTLPKGLKRIGREAFKDCTSLKKIDFSDDVIIDRDAFLNCPAYSASNDTPTPAPTASSKPEATETPAATQSPKPTDTPAAAVPKPSATAAPASPEKTAEPNRSELKVISDSNGITILADGVTVKFDEDAQPFIDENGRTQIPIRSVSEALGCRVDWDNNTNTAAITKGAATVFITIGNAAVQVGDNIITMDTTAKLINDRTYIPVRFVGEALGLTVNWEGK